jgi:ATP-binding cassette subfamily B protein/ATP-binding cassette subfamily C protein
MKKTKEKWSRAKIVKFFVANIWEINSGYILILCVASIVNTVFPFVNIIFPMLIINELTGGGNIYLLIRYCVLLALLDALYYMLNEIFLGAKKIRNEKLMLDLQAQLSRKFVHIRYEKLEDSRFWDLESRALFPIIYQNSLNNMFDEVGSIVSDVIRFAGLAMIIFYLSRWIVLFCVVSSLVYIWSHSRIVRTATDFQRELEPINRKFTYYIHMVTDFKRAKDIRVYHAEPLISDKIGNYNLETYEKLQKLGSSTAKYGCLGRFFVVLQKLITYFYVTMLTIKNNIALGQFTVYISSINQLADCVNDAIQKYIDFRQNCDYLSDYIQLLKECDASIEQDGKKEYDMPDGIEKIEFENVTFSYTGDLNQAVIKNVSFTLKKGSQIAIVGENGSGKTTLIKLLLRFFEPQQGRILLNGIDVRKFHVDEYRNAISAVFQDYFIPQATIEQNITAGRESDYERLEKSIRFAGLEEMLAKQEKGIETFVGRQLKEEGILLSGGQEQKLAIARMMYKGSQINLLDEPTAALDPITEEEIYSKINEMAHKCSENMIVFISHRLSSCKFCDCILVFENGRLCEQGSHEELMENAGTYKRLWEAQMEMYI